MWCIIGHTTVKKAIIKMSKLRLPVGFCILVFDIGADGTKCNFSFINLFHKE